MWPTWSWSSPGSAVSRVLSVGLSWNVASWSHAVLIAVTAAGAGSAARLVTSVSAIPPSGPSAVVSVCASACSVPKAASMLWVMKSRSASSVSPSAATIWAPVLPLKSIRVDRPSRRSSKIGIGRFVKAVRSIPPAIMWRMSSVPIVAGRAASAVFA